jgi:hypothetical protein
MNPFEQFIELKSHIETNAEVMHALRVYASNDFRDCKNRNLLPYLGEGLSNIHFHLGKVDDFWLATREEKNFDGHLQRNLADGYITLAVRAYNKDRLVPRVCGGVVANSLSGEERFFLLVEDLEKRGKFSPADMGVEVGILDGKSIYYDFNTEYFIGGVQYVDQYAYVRDEQILDLRKK